MKIKPNANIPRFLQAVQSCQGAIRYTTPEGDDLNLKSALSQFVFAAVVAGQLEEMHGDIKLQNSEDLSVVQSFLL